MVSIEGAREMTQAAKRIADALEKMAEALTKMAEAAKRPANNQFTLYAGKPQPAFQREDELAGTTSDDTLCGPCEASQGERHVCWHDGCSCIQHDLHVGITREE